MSKVKIPLMNVHYIVRQDTHTCIGMHYLGANTSLQLNGWNPVKEPLAGVMAVNKCRNTQVKSWAFAGGLPLKQIWTQFFISLARFNPVRLN